MRWIDALGPTVFLIDACVGPPEPDVRPPLEIWAEVQQDGPQWFLLVGATGFNDAYSGADILAELSGTPTILASPGEQIDLDLREPWLLGWPDCFEVEIGPVPDDAHLVWLSGLWTSRTDWYEVVEEANLPLQAVVYSEPLPGGAGRCRDLGVWAIRSRDECFRSPNE